MKKRRLIPVVAVGGVLAAIFSQFSLNLGVSRQDTTEVDPEAQPLEELPPDSVPIVSAEDSDSVINDAKLWLIDVLIDGQDYSVAAVTSEDKDPGKLERKPMTVSEIVQQVEYAEGDASGTRVRISRTPEAIAIAEQELTAALDDAGIAADSVERRQRLVE